MIVVRKTQFMIIALLALIVVITTPVQAEIISGTLGSSENVVLDYTKPYGGGATSTFDYLYVNHSEYLTNTKSLVLWEKQVGNFDSGAPNAATTTFIVQSGGTGGPVIGSGTVGYQRYFNFLGIEQPGVKWMMFNTWNLTGISGDKELFINYSKSAIYHSTFNGCSAGFGPYYGSIVMRDYGGNPAYGDYRIIRESASYADYYFEKPSGIGITGYINKTVGGIPYYSKVFVFNQSGGPITSDSVSGTNNVLVFTPEQAVKVSMYSQGGNWYNTSTLFSVVAPTPTPTVTSTIPVGYVRTYAYTSDCISGARISESDIAFKNLDLSTWSNSTQDPDGKYFIDTLPYTNLDIYGAYTKTALQYGSDSYISQNVGLYGGQSFALQLCPTQQNPGTGNTNVLVTVYDTTNYLPLPYTTVSLKLSSTGATTIDSTGSSGTASFVTTNNSVIILTASKAGYITGAKTLTTSTGLITTAKLYLDRQIVTTAPTLTSAPGGTIPTTIDPAGSQDSGGNYPAGYSNIKGQQMLDWLAANGMMLVQLCFMVTVLALFGKFGK